MACEAGTLDRPSRRWRTSFDKFGRTPRLSLQTAASKSTKRIALYPIVFFQIYLAASVLTFAFGPWPWPVSNPLQLYTFLFLAQVALFFGYRSAINTRPRSAATTFSVPAMVNVSLVFNYLWIGQIYKIRTGQTSFDLSAAITAVTTGFTNPGEAYNFRQKNYLLMAGGATTTIDYITLLAYPVLWITFPLGVVFWRQLSIRVRIALVVWIILDLLTWVAAGTNKGIADFVLLLPCLVLIRKPAILVNIKLRKVMVVGLVAVLGVAALFAFFTMGILGRRGAATGLPVDAGAGIAADPDNLFLRYAFPELQGPMAMFASYFSHGYYGLSLSLKEPFIFCYGVGNSYLLEGWSRHLVKTPIMESTYPARIESSGWARYGRWHSIYPWIASDLSFPGTIVFMFLIGRLFALVWLDAVFCRNPCAVCLLALVLTMLFYVPANNQVLAFPGAAIPFWALLILWSLTRNHSRARDRKGLAS